MSLHGWFGLCFLINLSLPLFLLFIFCMGVYIPRVWLLVGSGARGLHCLNCGLFSLNLGDGIWRDLRKL